MKTSVSKKIAIEYLGENENFRETVFACSYGAQVESFKPKNGRKSSDTVPLKGQAHEIWLLT